MSLTKEITNLHLYKGERNRILSQVVATHLTNFSDLSISSKKALELQTSIAQAILQANASEPIQVQ